MENDTEQKTESLSKYHLDSLLKMDWETEVSPLVEFLNLGSDVDELRRAVRESEILKDKGGSPSDFIDFRKEMDGFLHRFYEMDSASEAKRLEKFLTRMLANAKNKVKIIDLADKQIRVRLEVSTFIQNLWADFICIFLQRDDWTQLLGKCPQCAKYFERSRKNQIYCGEVCKNKAAYARNADVRRLERRIRYRKGRML